MGILKESMILRVFINHHIKVLSAFWVLNIKPYFLTSFTPIIEVAFLHIAPYLLELLVCKGL